MTKEELKQEAEESAKKFFGKPTDLVDLDNLRIFKNGYLASAESREKRVEELEKACEETQELLDKQIEATYKLDKENAELKDYRLTTLAKQQTDMSKYALNLEHKLSWYDDQLTKAKELLEKLLITSCNSDVLNLLSNCSEVLRVRAEAEQFLSEVPKWVNIPD